MKKPSLNKIRMALGYWNAWPNGMRPKQIEYLDCLHFAAMEYLKIKEKDKPHDR